MSTIDKVDVAATFTALPWRIASEEKAKQAAMAIAAACNTQAVAFNGGDAWFVLAMPSEALEGATGAARVDAVMSLLNHMDATPAEDFLVERLPEMPDELDEQQAAQDILFRGEYAIDLAGRIDELSGKMDAIARMIGPVDVRPVVN